MSSFSTIKIYAIIKTQNEDKIILQNSKAGLNIIQGKFRSVDPSPIFTATRIFVKKLYTKEDANDWHSEIFQHWLPQFTHCELIRHDNGDYSFIIEILSEFIQIQNDKLQAINLSDLEHDNLQLHQEYTSLAKDVAETYKYYEMTERAKNHFAIFNCEANENFTNFYEALYQGLFKNKGEIWKTYKIGNMEFPTEEELKKVKGVVISGSEWSVYNTSIEAIPVFLGRLRNLIHYHPSIKIIGICFGCQSLAQTLGGKVSKMKLENKPMLMNREKLNFMNNFNEKYIKSLKLPEVSSDLDSMYIVECHGDNVEVLPNGAILYCTSDSTPVEVWGMGDNILAFQGHPEFNAAIMLDKILPEEEHNIMNYLEVLEESKNSLLGGHVDTNLMAMLCQNFLKAN